MNLSQSQALDCNGVQIHPTDTLVFVGDFRNKHTIAGWNERYQPFVGRIARIHKVITGGRHATAQFTTKDDVLRELVGNRSRIGTYLPTSWWKVMD